MKRAGVISGMCVVILLSGCISQSPSLKFSSGPCDESIDGQTTDLGVKNVEWLDDTTMVVTVLVNINCGEEIEGGDFKIYGNNVILIYDCPQCETCTFCYCVHEMTYRFTNIEKQDYTFELERIT